MLGVYVCLGSERTRRFELPSTQVEVGSHGSNDLVLRDGDVAAFHCTLTREHGEWSVAFAEDLGGAVLVNGHRITSPWPIADGDRLRVGRYVIVIELALRGAVAATAAIERDLLDAIVAGDDAARLVYADWLEENGDRFRAEFLRVQQIAFADGTNADDPDVQHQLRRLRDLASHIDIVWRQRVGRAPIQGCLSLGADCPGEWSRLAATDNPRVRRCETCSASVVYCRSATEAHAQAVRYRTVVDICDPSTIRVVRPGG